MFNFTALVVDETVQECTCLPYTQRRSCSDHLGQPSIQNNAYALSLSDWSKTEKALLSAM